MTSADFLNRVFRALLVLLGLVTASAASAVEVLSFEVFAKQNSIAFISNDASPLDTGLLFNAGDPLKITASGSWNGGACGDVGPDGTGCFGEWNPGIVYYALVGRLGAAGTPFKVGSSFDGVANGSGNLFLFFVDSDSFNNSGSVIARVHAPIPEPGTTALLAAGLGMLVLRATRRGRSGR